MEVEWIGGPHDGDFLEADAEDEFVEFTFVLPGGGSSIRLEIPIQFRENGKPIVIWKPEFSRYSF